MIRHHVEWTVLARGDLAEIAHFIADHSMANAERVMDRIEARAASLTTMSASGRVVPELRQFGMTHLLEILERPWRIFYVIEPHRVLVMGVLDGRRDLNALLGERYSRPLPPHRPTPS
jgi:toxin ParE1/3/4